MLPENIPRTWAWAKGKGVYNYVTGDIIVGESLPGKKGLTSFLVGFLPAASIKPKYHPETVQEGVCDLAAYALAVLPAPETSSPVRMHRMMREAYPEVRKRLVNTAGWCVAAMTLEDIEHARRLQDARGVIGDTPPAKQKSIFRV